MALRLTHTSLTPPSATSLSGDDAGRIVTELGARAGAFLAASDTASYRGLFSEAAALEDPNRRYHAVKTMLEQGFAAAGQAAPKRCAEILSAVAEAAVGALEREPREPVVLNYAGVALYELWSLDAARALFKAAQRLDPELPHVERNLTELRRRRRSGQGRAPSRTLPALARRAMRVAAQARPATGLTLSLCMIVRDEEEMLPRCLAAVAPAVDEIVIVDTGSTDRTIEIARSFGARVIEREWTGSFADARNVSFDAATGDWIVYLDADEVLVESDRGRLSALTGRTWREAFYLTETNFTGHDGDGTGLTHNALRVFRNRQEYRFEGRLHEQIAQHLPAYVPERLEQTAVRIEHYGYLGAVRDAKEKSRRNIELLLAQRAESPPTPFLHFNLGSEYAAAGDARAALAEFEQAWEMVESERAAAGGRHEFTPSLLVRLVKALRAVGRAEDAIARAERGLELFPGFTDLVFEQATASLACGRRAEAVAYYERCTEMGDAPAGYTATVGCGTYLPRLALAELQIARGELAPAIELLDWCLEHHPGFFGPVLPYTTARIGSGARPEEVIAEIEQRVAATTPTVRFMLGTGLYETGALSEAEAQFRLVLAAQPRSGQARVALGESLLAQRRYLDAAAESQALDESDPLAVVAVRSELFGRIAGGDVEGARGAAARAARVGLPWVEQQLFEAWIEIVASGQVRDGLPAAATPLLGVILEALLKVGDADGFGALHPLLVASELPERERRELLACIYFRQGLLRPAATEWMAVCNSTPDARALLGLARVATAHDLPEDAATFAAEALRLDPQLAAARQFIPQIPSDRLEAVES